LLADIGLGYLLHGDSGLDSDGHLEMLKGIGESEGVHDGGEHTHMVGSGSVHIAARNAAPEVAAADDKTDLNAISTHSLTAEQILRTVS